MAEKLPTVKAPNGDTDASVPTFGYANVVHRPCLKSCPRCQHPPASALGELALGLGIRVGRKRVERLMAAQGLQGVTRRRRRGLTPRDALLSQSWRRVRAMGRPHRFLLREDARIVLAVIAGELTVAEAARRERVSEQSMTQALGEAPVEIRVWKKSARGEPRRVT
jgi:transposase